MKKGNPLMGAAICSVSTIITASSQIFGISEDSCCDHVHSDVVFKVYTCGEFKGYYYIDGFKTQADALLALCEMFGCGCVDDVRMEATVEE